MKMCGMLSRMFHSMIDVSYVRWFHIHLESVWMMLCIGGHRNVWIHNNCTDLGIITFSGLANLPLPPTPILGAKRQIN